MKIWIVALLACAPFAAQAGVYRCTDGGHTIYSDTPCGDR